MRIYTIQMATAKHLALFSDDRFLDVTVKSGDRTFAPTWKMVMGSKEGKLSAPHYADMYLQLMRDSYRKNRKRWREILEREAVILACYCPAGSFCHRYLLKDMMVKCGGEYAGEIREIEDLA